TGFHQTLGLTDCFDSTTFPIGFGFGGCIGTASLGPGNSFTSSGQVNLAGAPASEIVAITLVSDPVTDATLGLAYVFNGAAVAPTCTPVANVPSVTQSGIPYNVSWSQVSDPTATFTIEESTASDFSANLVSRQVSGTSAQF